MLTLYLKSVDRRIHLFASSVAAPAIKSLPCMIVVAVPELSINLGSLVSIKPMYAWSLCFHVLNVPYSPMNVGGCILYPCILMMLCKDEPSCCASGDVITGQLSQLVINLQTSLVAQWPSPCILYLYCIKS